MARELGVSDTAIQNGLAKFQGIGRRFHNYGELDTPAGPVTLDRRLRPPPTRAGGGPRCGPRRLARTEGWCWPIQPHRYTRTRDLFDDFAEVLSRPDVLLLERSLPGRRGMPISGADGRALARAIRVREAADSQSRYSSIPIDANLPVTLARMLRADDILLIMGAGDIGSSWPLG